MKFKFRIPHSALRIGAFLLSTFCFLHFVVGQTTTNNPGVPIFGAGGTSSGLQFVFVNGLGNVAVPVNFAQANASSIVTSSGATNAQGLPVAFGSIVSTSITNGSSAAVIQAAFNSITKGGKISFAPGDYNLSTAISITNPVYIEGNGAVLHWTNSVALLLTNAMLDTGTNYGKPIIIDGLGLDGGMYFSYNASGFYDSTRLFPNGFYGDTFWSNRTAMRIEASGGAIIKNCNITGWSGNGILGLNVGDNGASTHMGRLTISQNRFATNFAAIFLPGSSFEVSGYNNNPSSGWADFEPDYSLVLGNQIDTCQNGIVNDCANDVIEDNVVLNSYFGILENALGGNAMVIGNNLNHNTYCGVYAGGGNGFPSWIGNTMIAPGTAAFLAITGTAITFEHNFVSGPLIFTNGCTGTIIDNRLFPSDPWGSGQVTTNINAGMVVAGNFDQAGALTDLSGLSLMEVASTPVFFTNQPALSVLPTNGFSLWVSNQTPSTNNFYLTVNSNNVQKTYHLLFQP